MFGNLRKFSENYGNGSKVIFRCFYGFLKFSENLRKSSKVFENLRKFSENFGNGSKVTFRCFYDFLIFSENLWSVQKSSVIFSLVKIENILRGTRMYCHMDSVSGLFSSKTLLLI